MHSAHLWAVGCGLWQKNRMTTTTYSKIEGKSLKFNTAQDVAEVCADICAVGGLREIRLSGNTFGVEACRAIAKAVAVAGAQLEVVGFSDMFTGRLKDEIPVALDAFVEALEDKVFASLVHLIACSMPSRSWTCPTMRLDLEVPMHPLCSRRN